MISIHMKSHLWVLILAVFGCEMSPGDLNKTRALVTEVRMDWTDSIVRKIYERQDHLESSELLSFFTHPDPTYRYFAVNAFSSIKDTSVIDSVASLLFDPIEKVRVAAGYALGQIGNQRAETYLIDAFQSVDTLEPNTLFNCTLLEAVGKCGSPVNLKLLSEVETYTSSDDLLILGQARAINRFLLRGISHPEGTHRMVELLHPDFTEEVQILAAHYLSRIPDPLKEDLDNLIQAYQSLENAFSRMYIILAIGKTGDSRALPVIRQALRDSDYRLRCNALRGLRYFNYPSVKNEIHRLLRDEHLQVAKLASELIVEKGQIGYWREYMNLSLEDYPWTVKCMLLGAANKFVPAGNAMFRNITEDLLIQNFRNSNNDFEKAALIKAISLNPFQFRFLLNQMTAESPILRTAAAEALTQISTSDRFFAFQKNDQKTIINAFISVLDLNDVALTSLTAQFFINPDLDFSTFDVDPVLILTEATTKLKLPRDVEAYNSLRDALIKLDAPLDNPGFIYTHPIDWNLISKIEKNTRVRITTQKGDIIIELLVRDCPGTVANFLELVSLNYYSDKVIHRVVPNFVIQGGCNRGDGYGSMDYTIRSEFQQMYYNSEGCVGMASAGPHTESMQWFITHNPTPHLDGNYTLFARVVDGMEVVHQISVGDRILEISVVDQVPL